MTRNLKKSTKSNLYFLGCRVDPYSPAEFANLVEKLLQSSSQHYLVTPNPEIILLAQQNPLLKKIINDSDLSLPDGAGLQWAAIYQDLDAGHHRLIKPLVALWQLIASLFLFAFSSKYASRLIPARVTGTDFVPILASLCADHRIPMFLLGAAPGVAKKTAQVLQERYPKLKIAGYSDLDCIPNNSQKIIQLISKSLTGCLMVAYGAPKQEQWIYSHLSKMPSVKVAIGIGGAFDFLAGESSLLGGPPAKRAPILWRQLRLEWLHRLINQPNRIVRIYRAVLVFPYQVFISKIKQ